MVPFRDLFLLIYPVTLTLKPFLAKQGHAQDDVEKMHARVDQVVPAAGHVVESPVREGRGLLSSRAGLHRFSEARD